MFSLDSSVEDIHPSISHYLALENSIKNGFLEPKIGLRNDSQEYQNAITKTMQYIDKVLFVIKSDADGDYFGEADADDDGSASENGNLTLLQLKYLNLYFFKHVIAMKRQAVVATSDKAELMKLENIKNQYRVKFLNESNAFGFEFLKLLNRKGILNGKNFQQFLSLQDVLNNTTNKSDEDYEKLFEKWQTVFPNNRESRMANYKFKKLIDSQISEFEMNLKKKIPELFDEEAEEGDLADLMDKLDEEVKIQYHMLLVLNLQKNSAQCISNIDANLQELQLLKRFVTNSAITDFHREKTLVSSNYEKSDKLDTQTITPQNINRVYGKNYSNVNFNLKNDQIEQIKKRVKGFGQYAPTQTIDDLLQEEIEQGRIITQSGEKLTYNDIKDGSFLSNKSKKGNNDVENIRLTEEEINEDNYEYQDMKTYEARDWDKFKESVTRGSGNMGRRRG